MKPLGISMLGTGLIADFYTMPLHGQRGVDRVAVCSSRSEERGRAFAAPCPMAVRSGSSTIRARATSATA
jgi:hypothetical protein